MTADILTAALDLAAAGYSVLPIRADGSKAPAVTEWKSHTTTAADENRVRAWFTRPGYGLAVVQGAVSGHAELTELEGRAANRLGELAQLAADTGLTDLWDRLTHGWLEMSPSGGFHFHYRVDGPVPGNTKLARRPSTPDELAATPGARVQVLAETRGEGGYVVVAPTPGTHHPTGRPWVRLAGGPTTAPTLTVDERDALHRLLRTLDQTPTPTPAPTAPPRPAPAPRDPADGITPGDDYEARVDWADILTPHGWTIATTRGRTRYWTRPGKQFGISATTGHADDRDRLYVFTSSTEFEPETPYTKLGALTVLEYHGDHSSAARDLAAAGYGQRATRLRPADTHPTADDLAGLIAPTNGAPWTPPTSPPESRATAPAGTTGPAVGAAEPATATTASSTTGLPTASSAQDAAATGSTAATRAAAPVATPASTVSPKTNHPPTTTSPSATGAETSESGPKATTNTAPTGTSPAPAADRPAEPNEDNTALLLVDHHADEIRYCPGRGTWLTWTGHRWTNDDQGHVNELIRAIARRLPDGEGWAAYRKHTLSLRGVKGIAGLAATDRRVVAPAAALDARPYELNTPAGVVALRTGTLSRPDPAALHTRSTTVAPDFDAPHPLWDRFLADTFAGDPDMTTYVQRLLGLSLVGVVLEQIFLLAYGAGANGKSTLLSVAQHLVGLGPTGYAMSAPATMLLATRNEGHPTELARLSGARLVVASELEDGQHFAEAKIKLLTGKDTVSGRFMGKDWFDFTPTHTLWLLANAQPAVRAGGVAFWRRVRQLPFEHTVPPEMRIVDLEDRLVAEEGPAILGWVLRGAADYFADGLAQPASVSTATAAYERDQDTVGRFVDERCEVGNPAAQHLRVRSGILRAAYESWCKAEGEEPMSAKAFTLALTRRFGLIPERSNTARYLAGIRLNDDENASPGDAPARLGEGW